MIFFLRLKLWVCTKLYCLKHCLKKPEECNCKNFFFFLKLTIEFDQFDMRGRSSGQPDNSKSKVVIFLTKFTHALTPHDSKS